MPESDGRDDELVRLHARVAELQRERDHLVAIVDILQEISSSLHFVDILQAIARKLGDAFGLDRARSSCPARRTRFDSSPATRIRRSATSSSTSIAIPSSSARSTRAKRCSSPTPPTTPTSKHQGHARLAQRPLDRRRADSMAVVDDRRDLPAHRPRRAAVLRVGHAILPGRRVAHGEGAAQRASLRGGAARPEGHARAPSNAATCSASRSSRSSAGCSTATRRATTRPGRRASCPRRRTRSSTGSSRRDASHR